MDPTIKSMLKRGVLHGGRILNLDGVIAFQRISLEELEKMNEAEVAFATGSMGRAIFQIEKNGKIKSIKGVDSHLESDEIITAKLSSAKTSFILNPVNPGGSYRESTYPINLVVYPGNSVDVRIRGASPLEDLEEEAEKNARMQGLGIKLPEIKTVREFSIEVAKKLGLPIKIEGNYDEFREVDYKEKNDKRKRYLHQQMGENYIEEVSNGLRAETLTEYFKRTHFVESEEFQQFAKENGITIESFIQAVDDSYGLGQRYGQTVRIMENPFRISDLEYYVQIGDITAVEDIIKFSNQLLGKVKTFENVFAIEMGINLAAMMNNGWRCTNFMHRQDYSLAGEMCDDSYKDVTEHLKYLDRNSGKGKDITEYERKQFYLQMYAIASNIKVIQNEMKLRGKSKDEIDKVLDDFIKAFGNNIDFEKVAQIFGDSKEDVKQLFDTYTDSSNDYVYLMAENFQVPGLEKKPPDEQVLLAQKDNAQFFAEFSERLAKELHLDRNNQKNISVFESAIEVTEEQTRIDEITREGKKIKTIQIEKNQELDTERE